VIAGDDLGVHLGGRWTLRGVSPRLRPGELVAVLGPNGAGKSTLLRCLAGERQPDAGVASLDAKPLRQWGIRALATRRAVLDQHAEAPEGLTVAELVALGRGPHGDALTAEGVEAIARSLRAAGVEGFAARAVETLSGGERQRVHLARALAQVDAPGERYLLLDEPSTHLDVAQQHATLRAVRSLTSRGVGVLAVLHELGLAARYADRVLLLDAGRVRIEGSPAEVLTPAVLREVWGVEFVVPVIDGAPHPVAVPRREGA
jgi:iron complex transport system ATP-binding protein